MAKMFRKPSLSSLECGMTLIEMVLIGTLVGFVFFGFWAAFSSTIGNTFESDSNHLNTTEVLNSNYDLSGLK
ncbi:MAG: hypothetical protein KDD53_06640 [Bdellovibrionales bacterium]|nr:hypothetical protein [Bdellovibrionales bacterium]